MELKRALEAGPLTGRKLYERTNIEVFKLWKACKMDKQIQVSPVGRPYLRFDKRVEGYARLSPALEREFLSYMVVGLKKDSQKIEEMALELDARIKRISEEKLEISKKVMQDVLTRLAEKQHAVKKRACFIIGGDVPLKMAHADPRPERSTGKMVAGSDLDIVVILEDDFPADLEKALDDAIYDMKYQLLTKPSTREEIDYIIKKISTVREQAEFDTFEHMVACKIINEGQFLLGSEELYNGAITIIKENNIPQKLKELESKALKRREEVTAELLETEELSEEAYIKMFTTTEEFGEIF